jgi:hypothetical protein
MSIPTLVKTGICIHPEEERGSAGQKRDPTRLTSLYKETSPGPQVNVKSQQTGLINTGVTGEKTEIPPAIHVTALIPIRHMT